MSVETACRICLSSSQRLCNIAGTPLQLVFEKVTGYPLHSGKRPLKVCFICQAQLIRCHKLQATAVEAEAVLATVLLHPETSLPKLLNSRPGLRAPLRIRPVECIDTVTYPVPIEVKTEPEVKIEPIEVENQPLEVPNAPVGVPTDPVGVRNEPIEFKSEQRLLDNLVKHEMDCDVSEQAQQSPNVGASVGGNENTALAKMLKGVNMQQNAEPDRRATGDRGNDKAFTSNTAEQEAVLNQAQAKMLIFLANGEQRLVTFSLPKESCTLLEVLEKVNVEVDEDTHIQCMQNASSEIDYYVAVGCTERIEDLLRNHPLQKKTKSVLTGDSESLDQEVGRDSQLVVISVGTNHQKGWDDLRFTEDLIKVELEANDLESGALI